MTIFTGTLITADPSDTPAIICWNKVASFFLFRDEESIGTGLWRINFVAGNFCWFDSGAWLLKYALALRKHP